MTQEPELTYWVGLQDDENEYVSTCGCVITRDGEARNPDACDVAWFACSTHEHAEDVAKAAEEVIDSSDDTGCDGDLTVVSKSAINKLAKALGLPQPHDTNDDEALP